MKNPIVAVTGGPGAGKTTFSAALAKALARNFSFVLLCNADPVIPAYNVWNVLAGTEQAGPEYAHAEPIRRVLACPDLNTSYIIPRLAPCPKAKQIGLLGGFINERAEQYDPIDGNAASIFLDCCREIGQVTIIDCILPQSDRLSMKAIQKADIVIALIEPNALGVAFKASQQRLFSSLSGSPIYIGAKVGKATPIEKFEYFTGVHFGGCLPYTPEARSKLERLDLFSSYSGEYGKTVNTVAEQVQEVANGTDRV